MTSSHISGRSRDHRSSRELPDGRAVLTIDRMSTLIRIASAFTLSLSLAAAQAAEVGYEVELTTAVTGFDGEKCWVHARAGAVPADITANGPNNPRVVMTTQKLLLTGSDVFYELNQLSTSNLGDSWSPPKPIESFKRQTVADGQLPAGASIAPALVQQGDETTVCDFVPQWHAASQRLLGIGQSVWYRDNRVMKVRPRGVAYASLDPATDQWSKWDVLQFPNEPKFQNAGSGSVQRVDLIGGDILLPIYFKEPQETQYSVTVCRCRFDGTKLHYIEHGSVHTVPVKRGFAEPSLTKFNGRYFLTLRNDDHGYVTSSNDGLHFDKPKRWTFDDGTDLGNYNTQQHWVTHSNGLYLVYTRRSADNDHVFRHRAPLFMARVEPDKLHVIRETERILVPERGARLGNFGVTEISPKETWVTVTEWMQPEGVEKHGSDNSIFVAKIKWSEPNELGGSRACHAVGNRTLLHASARLSERLRRLPLDARPSRRFNNHNSRPVGEAPTGDPSGMDVTHGRVAAIDFATKGRSAGFCQR